MQIENPMLALDFDFTIMARGIQQEQDRAERFQAKGNALAALGMLKERATVEAESIPFGLNE